MGKEKNNLHMNHLECIYFRYIFKDPLKKKKNIEVWCICVKMVSLGRRNFKENRNKKDIVNNIEFLNQLKLSCV